MNSARTFLPGKIIERALDCVSQELDNDDVTFLVRCEGDVLNRIMQHACEDDHTEVFGLLLGSAVVTPSGKLRTIVRDFIPAHSFAISTRTSVEVSAAELIRMDQIHEEDAQRSTLLKVGWFHTHPGHGIFMSATDRGNHALYRKAWHVALVVDPIARTVGFFNGQECREVQYVGGGLRAYGRQRNTLPVVQAPALQPLHKRRQRTDMQLSSGDFRTAILALIIAMLAIFAFDEYQFCIFRENTKQQDQRLDLLEKQLKTVSGQLKQAEAKPHP